MSQKDTHLTRALKAARQRTCDDYPVENAMTAHQDARPQTVPEPSSEERLRGSAPWSPHNED